MTAPPSNGNGKLLGVFGALALGAAVVMAVKHRRDGDEEEENPKVTGEETEKYLSKMTEDDLETLILEARGKVFNVKAIVNPNRRRSDKLVRKIPGDGLEDCEGTRVTEEVVEERPATEEETRMFEECEEDVAAERAAAAIEEE